MSRTRTSVMKNSSLRKLVKIDKTLDSAAWKILVCAGQESSTERFCQLLRSIKKNQLTPVLGAADKKKTKTKK